MARIPAVKYRVKLTWKKEAVVEAESREDAINQVLHGTARPKLHTSKAQLVDGKERSKGQTLKALPRWKKWHGMKQQGMRLWQIAETEGKTESLIHRGITKYESHLLEQAA